MRIGYLWFPNLPIQAALLRQPRLRGQPVLIAELTGRGRLFAASSECLAAGVTPAMTLHEARELVPSATILPPNPGGDASLQQRALDQLDRFSEAIEESPHEGAWFIPAAHRTPSDERRLGAAIGDGLTATLGLDGRLAIASGKSIARIAAQRSPPGVVTVVVNPETAAYLAPLPIALLPLSERAIERLKLLGIMTIGAFARLPLDTLPRRFGREAIPAWQLARGDDPAPFVPSQRPELLTLRQSFDPPVEDRTIILNVARSLLERLSRPLQAQGRVFRSIAISLGLDDGRIVEERGDLREPTNDPRHCHALLPALVEALSPDRSIDSVILQLGAIERERGRQGDLFGALGNERRVQIGQTVAEITRRYRGRLRRIAPGNSPTSLFDDRRLLLLPYAPDDEPTRSSTAEPASRSRPIRLISRGNRIFLVEPGAKDEIVALHARWEADEWWPTPAHRTYYRVRTGQGLIAILARDHDQQRWLLIERYD